jgi:hypothetical protein
MAKPDWFDSHVIISGDVSEDFKTVMRETLRKSMNERAAHDPRAKRTKKRFEIVLTKEQEANVNWKVEEESHE